MRVDPKNIVHEVKIYPRDEALKILYGCSYPVQEYRERVSDVGEDKYLKLSLERGYDHYRLTNVGEMGKVGILNSFYTNVREFMNREGEFLVLFNLLSGIPVSVVIRKIGGGEFLDFSIYPCPYGFDLLDDNFKYGDHILITEGIYDADSFRNIYRNTVAMLTSSVSTMQAEILNTLTDKFIIAFDNDSAGEKGRIMAERNLKKVNKRCSVEVLKVYNEDKDLGNMEEMKEDQDKYKERKEYYGSSLKVII